MRIQLASIALGIFLAVQSAYSADVAYQVDAEHLSLSEPTKMPEPNEVAIVDREWNVPGIEQVPTHGQEDNTGRSRTWKELPPPRAQLLAYPQFRIETAPGSRWPLTQTEFVVDTLSPLADDVWPLTRERYLREYCTEYVLGGITLQR